jgi:hypothetical protein
MLTFLLLLIAWMLFLIAIDLERIRKALTGTDEYGETPRAEWKNGRWNGVKE